MAAIEENGYELAKSLAVNWRQIFDPLSCVDQRVSALNSVGTLRGSTCMVAAQLSCVDKVGANGLNYRLQEC